MAFEDTFIGQPATVRTQLSLYNNNLKHLITKPVTEIKARELVSYWQTKFAPGTICALLTIYQRMGEFQGIKLDFSKLQAVVRRSRSKKKEVIWTKEQCEKALNEAWYLNDKLYQALIIAIHTGCRPEELRLLTWPDVSDTHITIKAFKYSPERQIPISSKLREVIINRRGQETVWPHCDIRTLKKLCSLAGVPKINWRCCRKYFATQAYEARISPAIIARLMGHSSPATSMKYYWQDRSDNVEVNWL